MSGAKRPASSMRISTTKRGTTIRATGSVAQALFDALTSDAAKSEPKVKEPAVAVSKPTGGAS